MSCICPLSGRLCDSQQKYTWRPHAVVHSPSSTTPASIFHQRALATWSQSHFNPYSPSKTVTHWLPCGPRETEQEHCSLLGGQTGRENWASAGNWLYHPRFPQQKRSGGRSGGETWPRASQTPYTLSEGLTLSSAKPQSGTLVDRVQSSSGWECQESPRDSLTYVGSLTLCLELFLNTRQGRKQTLVWVIGHRGLGVSGFLPMFWKGREGSFSEAIIASKEYFFLRWSTAVIP